MTTQATVTVKKCRDGVWDLIVECCPYCGRLQGYELVPEVVTA